MKMMAFHSLSTEFETINALVHTVRKSDLVAADG